MIHPLQRLAAPWFARRGFLGLGAAALGTASRAAQAEVGASANACAAPDNTSWTQAFDSTEVFGHTARHSVTRGERLDVMLALAPAREPVRARVHLYRLGNYPWGRKLIWTSDLLTLVARSVQSTAASAGTGWAPSLSADTAEWPEGCYSADVAIEGKAEPEYNVLQTCLRPARPSGQILVKLCTNTWQAYNAWGGHSLYPQGGDDARRGVIVSFNRPTPASLFEYESYLVTWLERLAEDSGWRIDYASNFDVHNEPALLETYPLVICGSHDEYWSKEEFDAFAHRIHRQGRNTIFFGANTAYWQVRYADLDGAPGTPALGRQLVCYKSMDDPVTRQHGVPDPTLLATGRFRDGSRRPETMLTGAGYQNWFIPRNDGGPRYPYRVARTDLPFFRETGLAVGDVLADIVGYEWDNRDPGQDGTRLYKPGVSRIPELPSESIKVLFTGTPVAEDGTEGLAEAVFFQSPAGAKVFNAGSIRWAWGLGRPTFITKPFRRFNANLVSNFLS